MSDRPVYLGTDSGATTSKTGAVWEDGTVVSTRLLQRPTGSQDGPESVVRHWVEAASDYLGSHGLTWDQVRAVGLAIPGPFRRYGVLDRSANLPAVLGPDRYVAGVGLTNASSPPVQIAGYFLGAGLAVIDPRIALALNAVSFGVSALLVQFAVELREPALKPERRTGLLRETAEGFRLVFTTPALRALVLLVFGAALFAVVPEATLKFGLKGERSRFFVGYNFLLLSDAVRPGDQIDRTVNPTQVPVLNPGGMTYGPDRPQTIFERRDFWVQGLMIGFEQRF